MAAVLDSVWMQVHTSAWCSMVLLPSSTQRHTPSTSTVFIYHFTTYSNSFIPRTSILWKTLSEECFQSDFYLNSSRESVNQFLKHSDHLINLYFFIVFFSFLPIALLILALIRATSSLFGTVS